MTPHPPLPPTQSLSSPPHIFSQSTLALAWQGYATVLWVSIDFQHQRSLQPEMALLPQITLCLSSLTPSLLHTHTHQHVTVVTALCLLLLRLRDVSSRVEFDFFGLTNWKLATLGSSNLFFIITLFFIMFWRIIKINYILLIIKIRPII